MKNTALIPELRFPEFEGDWSKNIISNISKKVTDGTHDTPKSIKEGVPYLTAIHVKDGNIDFENCYFLSEEDHEKIYKRCNPEFGDLLMVNIGAGTATSAMVNVDYEFSLKNVALIKPNKSKIVPSFFAHIQRRNSDRLRHQISSGGAQPFLSLKAIGQLKLNIPSLPEQQRIATFLTEVDLVITQLKTKKTLFEQYKKGVMQKIFSQEIRFKDDDGKDYPRWEKKKLGGIAEITTGSSNRQDSSLNGEFTFFDRSEDIRTSSRYLFEGQAVIVAGEGSDFVPKYYVGKFDLHQRTYAIMDFKKSDSRFIFFYIHFHRRYFLSQAVGSTVKSLRLPMFQKMPILLPNEQEQTKIANFLSDIDAQIQIITTQIENTTTFKKGLLQQMFV